MTATRATKSAGDAHRSEPRDAGAGPADRALDLLIGGAVAAVPLLYLPGFTEGFVVPRELLTFCVIGPLAGFACLLRPAAAKRAAMPLLFLSVATIGLTLPDPSAFSGAIKITAMPAAFVLAGAALGRSAIAAMLGRFAFVAAAVVLLGMLRRYAGFPDFLPDRTDVGLASTLGNSNAAAEALAPVVAAVLTALACGFGRTSTAQLGTRSRVSRRTLLLAAASIGTVGILLSESRAGLLALAAGLVPAAAAIVPKLRTDRRLLRIAVCAAVVLVAFFASPLGAGLRQRAASIFDPAHPTNEVRLRVWSATTSLIAERPFGTGGGRFDVAFVPHRDPREWRLSGLDSRVDHPHQEVLAAWAEGGPLAALAFVLLLAWSVRRGIRGLASPEFRPYAAALLAATAAFAAAAIVRAPFRHPSGVAPWLVLLGALGPTSPDLRFNSLRIGRWLVALMSVAIVAAAVASVRGARSDLSLRRAIDALNEGKGRIGSGDMPAVAASFIRAGDLLRASAPRPEQTSPDPDAARLFRAALAAEELSALRTGLAEAGEKDLASRLPDDAIAMLYTEAVLARSPGHPGATTLKASLERRAGHFVAAETTLRSAIRATPKAPRHRTNLAAVLADYSRTGDPNPLVAEKLAESVALLIEEASLGKSPDDDDRERIAAATLLLGSGKAEFGLLLRPVDDAPPPEAVMAASEHESSGRLPEARRTLLVALFDRPGDGRLLDALARVDFALARKAPTGMFAFEGGQAFARSRVRFAIAEEEAAARAKTSGNTPIEKSSAIAESLTMVRQAQLFVRLALQKNPRLLEARFLAARLAALAGETAAAVEALTVFRDLAADDEFAARTIGAEPILAGLAPLPR